VNRKNRNEVEGQRGKGREKRKKKESVEFIWLSQPRGGKTKQCPRL
jgi:hypothetical protein